MKLYLAAVTFIVFSFSALSGAVIASLHDIQFIRYESVRLIHMPLMELVEVRV